MSYPVGSWTFCKVSWPSLQGFSETKCSRESVQYKLKVKGKHNYCKRLRVFSSSRYFLKDQGWSLIVYFLCRHSLTSSGTMQREHRLFHQESKWVFHVNTVAVQTPQLTFWYLMWFSDKIDVWRDTLICTISGIGVNGTCWRCCQWSRVCLPTKSIAL
jgi:hypothetical protein